MEQTTQDSVSQVRKTTQSVSNLAAETTKDAIRVDQIKQVSPTREVQTTQGRHTDPSPTAPDDHTPRPGEPTSPSSSPTRSTTPVTGQIKLSEEDHPALSTTPPPPPAPTPSDHHTRSTTQRAATSDPSSRTACTSTTTSLPTTALPDDEFVDYDSKNESVVLVEAKPGVSTEEGERDGTEGSVVVIRGESVLDRDVDVQGRTRLGVVRKQVCL